nr:hypothetical protein [Tanacetum cinerariifolium]
VDPAKIESVKDWASPKSPTEIRQFLGPAGDYDCDIRYHPGKANVVADALSRKEREPPLNVRALVMTIILDLPKQILNAQTEARNPENIKKEDVNKARGAMDTGVVFFWMKEREPPLRVRALVMSIVLDLPRQILNAQTEARKPKNIKTEDVGGVVRFGKRGKLNPKYVGPFKVLEEIEKVAYKLEFPGELSRVYNTFHVSNLKKCHADEPLAVPLDELHFDDELHFVEEPVEIMDREVKRLKRSQIPLVKNALGTRLDMSTAYHPETDSQRKRTIQTLKDMLRACAIDFGKGWVNHLPLVEFSYNNSYHASIKAAPFEALYGRRCRSPVCWTEVGEAQILGPELIQETTEKIVQIKQRMDKVMLKVSPWKGVVRFGKRGKLNPRVHNTFHVSNLKKCHADEPLAVPLEGLHFDDKFHFVKEPVEIVDREVKRLKQSQIPLVK